MSGPRATHDELIVIAVFTAPVHAL